MNEIILRPGAKVPDTSSVRFLVRLMMAKDAMASGLRWFQFVFEDTGPDTHRDRHWALISAAGRAGETIRFLKTAMREGLITKQLLEVELKGPCYSKEDPRKAQSSLQTWGEIMGNAPPRHVRIIHRIRDNFFAHWDDKCKAISTFLHAENGLEEHTTFAIADDAGTLLGGWFPWEITAIDMDLFGKVPESERSGLIRQIGNTIAAVINITSSLIAAITEKAGLELEVVGHGS